jgi:hypothetical protein
VYSCCINVLRLDIQCLGSGYVLNDSQRRTVLTVVKYVDVGNTFC